MLQRRLNAFEARFYNRGNAQSALEGSAAVLWFKQAGAYIEAVCIWYVFIYFFYQTNWCFIATALCSSSPAALQHSKPVVKPAVFDQEKLRGGGRGIDCSLMPAVKHPKQSTSSHHTAHKVTHPHLHPQQIQNIQFTLIVFERETRANSTLKVLEMLAE